MMAAFNTLGLWNWVLAGFVLLALELLIPGVFLLWFGLGALLTAAISAVMMEIFPLAQSWQFQLALFLVFSTGFVMLGRALTSPTIRRDTDTPFLNRRTDALIGHITTLDEKLQGGHGHVRIADSLWRITGPDLPAKTRVRLVRFIDGVFEVERVD